MLTLFRRGDSPAADALQERLESMAVSHEVVVTEEPPASRLPSIKEGDAVYDDPERIRAFLSELERELRQARSVGGDACYLDPDDPTHCA